MCIYIYINAMHDHVCDIYLGITIIISPYYLLPPIWDLRHLRRAPEAAPAWAASLRWSEVPYDHQARWYTVTCLVVVNPSPKHIRQPTILNIGDKMSKTTNWYYSIAIMILINTDANILVLELKLHYYWAISTDHDLVTPSCWMAYDQTYSIPSIIGYIWGWFWGGPLLTASYPKLWVLNSLWENQLWKSCRG